VRWGVLDIGSQSANLWVVDAGPGSPPLPIYREKAPTGLAHATDADGVVDAVGIKRLVASVCVVLDSARAHGVGELLPYATSAVRDAANRDEIVAALRAGAGLDVGFLSGEDEGRLTYLAAHRWYGWSAGGLLVLDIGGGSMEIVHGSDEEPAVSVSLPIGAGRLTRSHLGDGPAGPRDLHRLRRHIRLVVDPLVRQIARNHPPGRAVATSRTFTQLAGFAGEPGRGAAAGLRVLRRRELRRWVPKLAAMSPAQRARLPGVSRKRARQMLAGAVVAETVMGALGVDAVEICPWALREGILLRRIGCASGPELRSVPMNQLRSR
jgi:exopolyphosphatase/guanosine-5'-triphosphate,3'-diphosphate pyrophosphatase